MHQNARQQNATYSIPTRITSFKIHQIQWKPQKKMASNSLLSHLSSHQNTFIVCLLLVSLPLLLLTPSFKPKGSFFHEDNTEKPPWFDVIARDIDPNTKIKVGFVNIDETLHEKVHKVKLYPQVLGTVSVKFDHVDEKLKWQDFFPEWIDEDHKWGHPKCPHMPMPMVERYKDVNVVVARVPCGIRDLFRLQVNLVVANLAVRSGWVKSEDVYYRKVYVVFIGEHCGPMVEIFRCDDLLMHQGEYWVYKPQLARLKQKTLMPLGSCQIAPPYAETGMYTYLICFFFYDFILLLHLFRLIFGDSWLDKSKVFNFRSNTLTNKEGYKLIRICS